MTRLTPCAGAIEHGETPMPSGRSVVVRVNGTNEELEIRSAQGEVEVRIVLTEHGPVVTLKGARLEIAGTETVAVTCQKFEVAADHVDIRSQGLDVRTEGDIRMQGAVIRLN